MELVADRFVVDASGRALDLATGDRVELRISSAGGATEQRRWTLACDALQKIHYPSAPTMIDFGIVGDSRRFEARRGAVSGAAPDAPSLIAIERPAVIAAMAELFEE